MNEEMKKQVEMLIDFLIELHENGLINNHDFDYEKEALYFIYKRYENDDNNGKQARGTKAAKG